MAATSTFKTFLMHGTVSSGTTTYEKLIDIKDFPDLGGDPEMLETTTLSDKMKTYILGIQGVEGLKFSANYDATSKQALNALEGKNEKYAVWFGGTESNGEITPTGSEGKFSFEGELSSYVTGGSVNEVRGISITIAPSTAITESYS